MNESNVHPICGMTPEGIQEAKEYLSILRERKRLRTWRRDLDQLLSDPVNAQPVEPEIFVERRPFANRRQAGEYLYSLLSPMGVGRVTGNQSLWSWLGMFFLEQATSTNQDGTPRISRSDEAYVLDPSLQSLTNTSGHRHRLMAAYEIYANHGEKAWCMLDQPLHRMERFTLRIFGAPILFNSTGVVELAHLLYANRQMRQYKTGFGGAGERGQSHSPGSLPRLIDLLNQLYMNFDVYGMTAEQLLQLLPDEFDYWKPAMASA